MKQILLDLKDNNKNILRHFSVDKPPDLLHFAQVDANATRNLSLEHSKNSFVIFSIKNTKIISLLQSLNFVKFLHFSKSIVQIDFLEEENEDSDIIDASSGS